MRVVDNLGYLEYVSVSLGTVCCKRLQENREIAFMADKIIMGKVSWDYVVGMVSLSKTSILQSKG